MKIELHTHSKEISPCGKMILEELIPLYREAGYDLMVLTNHFSPKAENYLARQGITDFSTAYFETAHRAEQLGEKYGIRVLWALELCFYLNANDYLVFGMPEELCLDHKQIMSMNPKDFNAWAKENGALFYQAHPFRNNITVVDPASLYGIEICNTHPRHDSRNDIAKAWAEKYGLPGICGSDCHMSVDVGRSAIFTDNDVRTMADLVNVLKNGLYTMWSV